MACEKLDSDSFDHGDVDDFVRKFLRRDGLFLVRLVAKNSSEMIAADLLCGLWEKFKEHSSLMEKLKLGKEERREMKTRAKEEHNKLVRESIDLEDVTS